MRLLELRAPGDPPLVVRLHPRLSVVTGLAPTERARLIEALDSLRTTRGAGLGGVVEAHGVLFDLTPAALDLLDVPPDVDLLVRATEMPGAREGQGEETPAASQPTHERLARAQVAMDEAVSARMQAEAALRAAAVAGGRQPSAARSAARAALERLDRALAERVEARRRAEETVERATAVPPAPSAPPAAAAALAAERARLEAELAQAEADLARIDTAGPSSGLPAPTLLAARDRALEALRFAIDATAARARVAPLLMSLERAEEAADLAAEWRSLPTGAEIDPVALARRVVELQEEVARLEAQARPARLGPEERTALDNAHDAVIVAQERVDRSLVKSRPRRELEEALAAERELLARLGFDSYSEYLLSGSMAQPDASSEVRLTAVRTELEDTQAALAAAQSGGLDEGSRRELARRITAVLQMPPGGDPLPHLDAVAAEAPEAGARLVEALRRLGVEPGLDPVVAARALLASPGPDVRAAESEVARLEAEVARHAAARDQEREAEAERRDAARRRVDALRRQLEERDAGRASGPPGRWGPNVVAGPWVQEPPPSPPPDAIDDLRRAVAAEARVRRARRAAAEELAPVLTRPDDGGAAPPGPLVVRLQAAVAAEARVAGELADARRQVEQAPATMPDAAVGGAVDVEELEYSLMARVAGQRSVSYAGSLPLVVDDVLGALGEVDLVRVLERLGRLADTVQVVLLSDQPDVVGWVRRLPPEQAALVLVRAAA